MVRLVGGPYDNEQIMLCVGCRFVGGTVVGRSDLVVREVLDREVVTLLVRPFARSALVHEYALGGDGYATFLRSAPTV